MTRLLLPLSRDRPTSACAVYANSVLGAKSKTVRGARGQPWYLMKSFSESRLSKRRTTAGKSSPRGSQLRHTLVGRRHHGSYGVKLCRSHPATSISNPGPKFLRFLPSRGAGRSRCSPDHRPVLNPTLATEVDHASAWVDEKCKSEDARRRKDAGLPPSSL